MLLNTCFYLDYLQISVKAVPLQCVFHSIRFKVNKGWSKALLLFLCPYVTFSFPLNPLRVRFPLFRLPFQSVSFLLQRDNNPTFRPTTIVAYINIQFISRRVSFGFSTSLDPFLYEFRFNPRRENSHQYSALIFNVLQRLTIVIYFQYKKYNLFIYLQFEIIRKNYK